MSDASYPRLFGKYVLLRPLARGGMGALYLASVGDLGGAEKLCVLKKLPESGGLRDESKVRRLLDEARVMVRLNHTNLVQVFDAGLVDGELYLAMELVAGRDLRAAWNRCADLSARIPVDMALFLVREVARGLAFAHSYGGLHLVHRDIAPPNILCSWQGEVKITDFGLAASRLKSEKTGPGVVYGRVGYLAPEQARGEAADHRADIYSLGVILWELLTGRPLVDPALDAAEALRVVRGHKVEPPSQYARDLPPSLDQVVLRALSPRREARYSIADEMRQAVGRELLRIAPDVDQGCVVSFLRRLYGDEIEAEQDDCERLLREELPRLRAVRLSAPPQLLSRPGGPAVLTGLRAEIAARYAAPAGAPQPAPAAASPPDVSGRVMQIVDGRYRIERLLGKGGMGAVYEAEHVAIRKKVALKILHRPFSQQADLVTRFRREAQAASRIGHPNIIDVTDFGYTQDGSAYLVMEHLDGLDLGQVLEQRGCLGQGRSLRIAVQLAQALSAAHAAGVIHRDLKPENIYLLHPEEEEQTTPWHLGAQRRDFVKVLDFGIAMRLEPSVPIRLTDPGFTVGTPSYMAPEQASGSQVDGRADIYAVGTILYEMLAGRVPFDDQGALGELLLKKIQEAAPRLGELDPTVPPALEALVARCLERDPGRRPQSMGELLKGLLSVQAALGPPPGAAEPAAFGGPAPLVIVASTDRQVLGSDPTVPFSTAEHGALLPRSQAPPPLSLSPLSSPSPLPIGPLPRAPASGTALGPSPAPEDDFYAPAAPSRRRLHALLLGGAALLLVSLGFALSRYWPGQAAAPRVREQQPSASKPPPAASPGPALRRDGAEAAALLEWARRAAEGGRYLVPPGDNLLELLGRIEAQAPGHGEARRLRESVTLKLAQNAKEQLRRKEADGALLTYRILSALRPDAPFPRSELGQLLLAQARSSGRKNRPRALLAAMSAVEVNPESVAARLLLGELSLQSGQRERAISEFQRALGLHPSTAEARLAQQGLAKAGGRRRKK